MSNIIFQPTWTRKPLKPVFDLLHPAIKNADNLLSFDRVASDGSPWDDAAKVFWVPDTTGGTTAYKKQPIRNSMQFARQDIDESGICYKAPVTGLNPNNVPIFVMVGYTVLAAPAGSWRGIISIGNTRRDSSGCWNITSNGATNWQSWVGGSRFPAPLEVGKKHFIIYRFDGNTGHQQYNSTNGYWQTLTQASSNGTTSDHLWLGTAYIGELPVAFDYLVGSIGSAPSIDVCNSLVKNPYQIFKPKTYIISDAVAPPVTGIEVFRRRMIMRKSA